MGSCNGFTRKIGMLGGGIMLVTNANREVVAARKVRFHARSRVGIPIACLKMDLVGGERGLLGE